MYNLAISVTSSVMAGVILGLITGYYQWGIVAGIVTFFALNYILSKRIMNKVEILMAQVTKDLQAQRFEKAIKTLKDGYKLGDWQFFIKQQLQSQIGTIYFLMKDDTNAFEYLQNGFTKHWVGMGMLAVMHMKRKQKEPMVQTFEKAVKATPKESLLWSLYAYCVLKEGDRDKALEIISRGLTKLPDDEKLKANQTAVANKDRMKMRAYGEMWTQFYLEKTPPAGQKLPAYMVALAQSQGRRRMVRR